MHASSSNILPVPIDYRASWLQEYYIDADDSCFMGRPFMRARKDDAMISGHE